MPATDKILDQIRNNVPQAFVTQALFPVVAVFTLDLAIYEWAVRDGNSILDRWSQWSQDLRGSAVALVLLALGALALGLQAWANHLIERVKSAGASPEDALSPPPPTARDTRPGTGIQTHGPASIHAFAFDIELHKMLHSAECESIQQPVQRRLDELQSRVRMALCIAGMAAVSLVWALYDLILHPPETELAVLALAVLAAACVTGAWVAASALELFAHTARCLREAMNKRDNE